MENLNVHITESVPQSKLSTTNHDFGTVQFGSTHCIAIRYLGSYPILASSFVPSCGCTSFSYDPNIRTATICLRMDTFPTKSTSVIVNIPEGQEIIQLSANVVPESQFNLIQYDI